MHTEMTMMKTIHKSFETQVEKHPEAIALTLGKTHLSYSQLDKRANQLAHFLKIKGMGRNTPVGIFLDRSFELIISMLAILKAGGAYVPLDPLYPTERMAFILDDTKESIPFLVEIGLAVPGVALRF